MKISSAILLVLAFMGLVACSATDSSDDGASTAATSEALGVWPPRCGPRNCVAMCVTCEYDICLHFGGTVPECNAEREACKAECNRNLCEEGTPGCPPTLKQ